MNTHSRTRFAPSPTGELHLGHAYAALVARHLGEEMLLRFEDIDHTRVRPQFYQQITDDLTWLGIHWDAPPVKQLDRLPLYADALNRLRSMNVIYPCICTRRDLQTIDAPHGPDGALYPGTCRSLQSVDLDRPHCWRLNAEAAAQMTGPLTFHDQLLGRTHVDQGLLGDVVLARKDIATSYHLSVVVDDAAHAISLVTRGEDLIHSTHVHRVLQSLLCLPEPAYHHHALITDGAGKRLAKRDMAQSLRTLRESGSSPADILAVCEWPHQDA